MTRRNYARVKQCPGGGPASHDIRLRVFARQRRFISRIRRPQLAAVGFVPSPCCVTGSLCTPHLDAYNVRKLPYDRLKRSHPFSTFPTPPSLSTLFFLIYVRSQYLFSPIFTLFRSLARYSIIHVHERGLQLCCVRSSFFLAVCCRGVCFMRGKRNTLFEAFRERIFCCELFAMVLIILL